MSVNHSNNTEKPEVFPPTYWGFWGTLLWGVLIAVVFVILQTVTIIVLLLVQGRTTPAAGFNQSFVAATTNGYYLSVVTFVTTIICTALVAGIIKLKKGSVLRDYLCVTVVPFKTMLTWGGILAVFIALADMLTLLLGRPVVTEFMSTIYTSAHPLWMLWIALIIAAPLFEEIFFRGFLYQGLASGFPGPTGAVLITAGLWSLIHTQYDAYDKALIFCLGLLLGAARARTGSLLVPLGLHAATNLEATIEAALFG